jgi:hypothetical protein
MCAQAISNRHRTAACFRIAARLLTPAEAASYVGLGIAAFRNNCPVRPKRIRPGRQGLRWDVRQLDEWIDTLPSEGGCNNDVKTNSEWLAIFDASDQGPRREVLPKQR